MRRPSTVDLMLLTTVILWSLNFTVTKYVLEHGFKPLAYSATRYGAAALIFAAFTFAVERSFRVRRRDVWIILAAAAVGIWANQLSYVYAIKLSSASTVALILGMTPIFTALFAFATGVERPTRRFWLAAAVSFGGAALVALGSGGGLSASLKGDALAVFTAATWALYSVLVAPLMRRYSPYRISALVLVLGWCAVAVTGLPQLGSQSFGFGWEIWALLVFATLGPLFLTNILWFRAIHRVGPSRATLFANIQPFIAAVFALLLLSERMTLLQVGGGILIGAGILLSRRRASVVPASE
jgi:drug/metabolite transporter (DMT)-like permease